MLTESVVELRPLLPLKMEERGQGLKKTDWKHSLCVFALTKLLGVCVCMCVCLSVCACVFFLCVCSCVCPIYTQASESQRSISGIICQVFLILLLL